MPNINEIIKDKYMIFFWTNEHLKSSLLCLLMKR